MTSDLHLWPLKHKQMNCLKMQSWYMVSFGVLPDQFLGEVPVASFPFCSWHLLGMRHFQTQMIHFGILTKSLNFKQETATAQLPWCPYCCQILRHSWEYEGQAPWEDISFATCEWRWSPAMVDDSLWHPKTKLENKKKKLTPPVQENRLPCCSSSALNPTPNFTHSPRIAYLTEEQGM